jgi:ribosomal protein L23
MARLTLLQNEKSLLLQKNNTYVLICDDMEVETNKIELTKKLKEQKLDAVMVRVVVLPPKVKQQNLKKGGRKTKLVKRAKKYYVTLKDKQKIDEKFEIIL